MQIDQIAIHDSREFAAQKMLNLMGAGSWSEDTVVAKGILLYDGMYIKCANTAVLKFNYRMIPGKELELIHYVAGKNFLAFKTPGGLSHFGVHVISIIDLRAFMSERGFILVQEVISQSHQSFSVPAGRRYHYAIYEHPSTHMRWKLIQRINDINADQELERIYDLL